MINKINSLRTVANNLKSHLCLEGKIKITKPGAILPGAIAAAGTIITLETKDNNANISVEKDNKELQNATFKYNETPDGYELVSAMSSYFYDDKEKKELLQNHYLIEPEQVKSYEQYVSYANAPMKKTTREYIDKLNASIAQVAEYKSGKTDYDSQESHTYGKKSLNRDIPALLKFLDVIAPDSEFTLKMKDKLKKDNKTSLVAFEVNNTENGNEIVRGFMSTNGDSVSYRINTDDMIIIGEQSTDKDSSRTYLKPKKAAPTKTDAKEKTEPKNVTEESPSTTDTKENKTSSKAVKPDTSKKEAKTESKQEAASNITPKEEPKTQPAEINKNHVYPDTYYTNLILEVATNKNSRGDKAKAYKEILAYAYLDGYSKSDLENLLLGNGLLDFSYYCKKTYVDGGIELVTNGSITQLPAKSLDIKVKELKNINIDIEDEELKICIQSMVKEITKIKDKAVKETFVDKALNVLNNSSSENFKSDLYSFMQEASKINDECHLHYEIYKEFVNNTQIKAFREQIEQMVNKISDTIYHDQRDVFLTRLYVSKDLKTLGELHYDVQKLLDEQFSRPSVDAPPKKETPKKGEPKKLSIETLSNTNQKVVKKLLSCKSPSDMSMSYSEIRNLLLDMGFTEGNVKGTHHKFIPPIDIYFNGEKQSFLTVSSHGIKTTNPAQIDDLINVCRQYYGNENN